MTLLYGAASPLCYCWRICCAFIGCSQMWHFRTRRGCRWTIIRCGTYAFSIGSMRLGCYRKWGWHRNSSFSFYIHIQNSHCTAFKDYKREMVFNGQRLPKLVLLMPTDVPSRALFGIRFDVKEMDAFHRKSRPVKSRKQAWVMVSEEEGRAPKSSPACSLAWVRNRYSLSVLRQVVTVGLD